MFNYRDSLALILKNSLLIVILGPKFLANGFLPQSLARLGQACVDFKYYMTEMVNEEKESIAQGNDGGANITNSLIRASQEVSQSAGTKETKAFSGLTEQEIYGNIFVYNFAGHDTTALTLCTAINLLAAFPDVQDWMAEEINVALEDDDPSTWNYPEVYPKLNRCLAVLVGIPIRVIHLISSALLVTSTYKALLICTQLETVRLWNPLIGIAKCTTINPQPLTMNGHDITIPPNTRIIPNINAIHAHPKYWGTDSLAWRPNRWIKSQPGATTQLDREYLHTPSKGSYVPWSDGARACPGKKFGQAEFVGAMVSLFRKHRVEVVPENGESVEEAQSRALNAVKDSRIVLLLQMRDPESVGLRWVEK
jgi:cytochrome P450